MRVEIEEVLAQRGITVDDESPDLVLALGGDGTMLHAARAPLTRPRLLCSASISAPSAICPKLTRGEELGALQRVLEGDYRLEQRMMLDCRVASDGKEVSLVGLNEVLVERTARHRLVRLEVDVSGEHLATFNADGVIVATPTGSTAYALSAGGPIISPRAEALVIVPVSPHMMFSRSVVLAPDDEVTIRVDESAPVASLSLDGTLGRNLQPGDVVIARRHERPLQLVRLSGPDFLERLRRKLELPS